MSRKEEYNRMTGKWLPEKDSLSSEEIMRRARAPYPNGLTPKEQAALDKVLKDKAD